MKIRNEKQAVFPFSFFNENEKGMRALKIQSKNLCFPMYQKHGIALLIRGLYSFKSIDISLF